jgi:hypothetical protein
MLTDTDVQTIRNAEGLPPGVPYEGVLIQPSVHSLAAGGFDDVVTISEHHGGKIRQAQPRSSGKIGDNRWSAEDGALAYGKQLVDEGKSGLE